MVKRYHASFPSLNYGFDSRYPLHTINNPEGHAMYKRTVTIDGPAASGKGTIASSLAVHFGFAHLDTGLLYRAVALRTLQGEEPVQAAQALRMEDVERDGLRDPGVSLKASEVAADPEVRTALIAFQRSFAKRDGGAVLDGRDIGTVICPDADAKLFVTARLTVRAARRYSELEDSGHEVDYVDVLQEMQERDARDKERDDAPLRQAEDAVVIDTSEMTPDEAFEAAIIAVAERI